MMENKRRENGRPGNREKKKRERGKEEREGGRERAKEREDKKGEGALKINCDPNFRSTLLLAVNFHEQKYTRPPTGSREPGRKGGREKRGEIEREERECERQ
jgi:hypothetical protein